MGGTGRVVTAAGLVFAFTMMSMVGQWAARHGQVGTTIGLGLLFDTLVVRSFMTPSIAALLGKWFWWPQIGAPASGAGAVAPDSACHRVGLTPLVWRRRYGFWRCLAVFSP